MLRAFRFKPSILARFGRRTSGVAAVEFALLSPIMLLMVFAGYESVRAINSSRRLTILANSIAQQITAVPPASGSLYAQVANADLHFLFNTAMVVFPQSMADAGRKGNYWWQDVSIGVSSVKFTPTVLSCLSSCTYIANVVWTSGGPTRSCSIPLVPQSDQASPNALALPKDSFGPGSLIVVDLTYNFVPLIGIGFFPSIQIKKSVYVQPRYASTIYYQGMSNDDIAQPCLINLH